MEKKRIGLIVTIVAVFLCGCPGLCGIVSGAILVNGYDMQIEEMDVSGDYETFSTIGIMVICASILLFLIPIGAGVYTFMQSRKNAALEDLEDVEIPPAI